MDATDIDRARERRVVDVLDLVAELEPIIDAIDALRGGYGRTFLVGGAVRDALVGAPVVDLDISVEGPGIELAEAIARQLGGRVTRHGAFGTATVTFGEASVDFATARSETYAHPGALPTVEAAAIESDLFRRDFTLNAMAIALEPAERGVLVDPYGGADDLAAGTLRVLHERSFLDDPTRIFRAARYEARLGCSLDAGSESLARTSVLAGLVGELSPTRVGNELVALLQEENAVAALERLESLGAVHALNDRLDASQAACALMRHAAALGSELDTGAPDWRVRLAVLVRRLEEHDRRRWLDSLQLSRRDTDLIARAAAVHVTLAQGSAVASSASELFALLGAEPMEAVVLALAEAPSGHPGAEAMRTFLRELRHVCLVIDGRDLADLGLSESPAVGRVLDAVLALRLDGKIATREEELDAACDLIREMESM